MLVLEVIGLFGVIVAHLPLQVTYHLLESRGLQDAFPYFRNESNGHNGFLFGWCFSCFNWLCSVFGCFLNYQSISFRGKS